MIDAPFAEGFFQLTRTIVSPRSTRGLAGGAGTPIFTGLDAGELAPVPSEFRAFTLKVYVVQFARPVIVWAVAGELNRRAACGFVPMNGVTTYAVIECPPFAGACQVSLADPLSGVAPGFAGAAGTAANAGAIPIVSVITAPAAAATMNPIDPRRIGPLPNRLTRGLRWAGGVRSITRPLDAQVDLIDAGRHELADEPRPVPVPEGRAVVVDGVLTSA